MLHLSICCEVDIHVVRPQEEGPVGRYQEHLNLVKSTRKKKNKKSNDPSAFMYCYFYVIRFGLMGEERKFCFVNSIKSLDVKGTTLSFIS